MGNEDLIKKLENIRLPEIEIKSHKKGLKTALLSSSYFKKQSPFEIFRKSLVFSLPALALLVILAFNLIQPKLTEAKALGIAKNNPEIKKLIEEKNMVLSEVKIKDGKAYVLLNHQEEVNEKTEKTPAIKIQKMEENKSGDEDIEGAIVEINLNQKEVAKINLIRGEDIVPLKDKDKESARKIVDDEEIIKEIIPENAEIEKIESSLPRKIHMVEENQEFKAIHNPDEDGKKAHVHYTSDGKRWIIRVDLERERVEEIEYYSDNQDEKGRD